MLEFLTKFSVTNYATPCEAVDYYTLTHQVLSSSQVNLFNNISINTWNWIFGYGALSGKMLLVRIVENNKIDDYFRAS